MRLFSGLRSGEVLLGETATKKHNRSQRRITGEAGPNPR